MNRMIKSGLMGGIGLGIATATMGYFVTPMMELSEAEQIASIEACAQHLGNEVVPVVGDLPDDCEIYSDSIGKYFYPTRSEFVADKMASVSTDEDLEDRARTMGLVLGGLGLVGGALIFGLQDRSRREEQTN